ncbi:hypothetical protein EIN_140010 [Entamoeba invadens IP1]|uniref:Leucine rich repeat containing protein BspA family protein n=1 Tax=Entamoeba invadens IP1 TaxID=370355 RepID=A0A0A1TXB6_ENTIV|nr:hypothetical protein EIN_140010 [Entamoeba invadens IP1]ELP84134.1 hypothetical protein EIN_140010 [Entamoeba invadens IP1]|eukprot:XP_004183480.1 hypothetical protein EIN_140010 [Entamoeba invadens IP1]
MSHIDGYNMMVVSQYFTSINDFIMLEFVNKKYRFNTEKFHTNPIPINYKTIKYFPKIETLNIWSILDETFGNNIFQNQQIYLSPKFDFFRINVWFEVNYTSTQTCKNTNVSFKNVIYTTTDGEKYGKKIPNNIKKIGDNYFKLVHFTSFQISQNVTSLGDNCFEECNLKLLKLPCNVYILGKNCFLNCRKLEAIESLTFVTEIGENCFCNCKHLSSVKFTENLCNLPNSCFECCKNLQEIAVPSRLHAIDDKLKFNNSIQDNKKCCIGDKAFRYCVSLKWFEIRGDVDEIGDKCFQYCDVLSHLEIPSSVSKLGNYCFNGCNSLSTLKLPVKLLIIPQMCFGECQKLQTICVPYGVTSIGCYCFNECITLQSVVISESVCHIGEGAFCHCESLKTIKIPSLIKEITSGCFKGCLSLDVVVPNTIITVQKNSFKNCRSVTYQNSKLF